MLRQTHVGVVKILVGAFLLGLGLLAEANSLCRPASAALARFNLALTASTFALVARAACQTLREIPINNAAATAIPALKISLFLRKAFCRR